MSLIKKIIVCVVILFACTGTALCHYSWIDFEDFNPLPGAGTKIYVCNGHYFPKSELAIKDRLVHEEKIISAYDGRVSTFTTILAEKYREGTVSLGKGTHIVTFSLRKPPLKEPEFCAKTIITAGAGQEQEFSYELGQLFEIVPQKSIPGLQIKDSLPLKLIYRGKPLKASLVVTVKVTGSIFKKNYTLRTGEDGLAELPVKKPGKYLVTAEYKGKGCSLSFFIK